MAPTVDSHQHYFEPGRFDYPWMKPGSPLARAFLPDNLRPLLDESGIGYTVTVQANHTVTETLWMLEMAGRNPWIAGIVGWVNLTDPEVGKDLDALRQHPKLVGIRHISEDDPDDRWLNRPDVLRGLGEVASRGLTYDLLLHPRHIACVRPIVDLHPDLKVIVDHIAKPFIKDGVFEPWAREMAEIAKIPHLHCKVSGMVTEADHANWKPGDLEPYINHVVEHFGEDRLLFGSDWPVCTLAASYQQVVESTRAGLTAAGVGEIGLEKIFGTNAVRFYGLQLGEAQQ